jgi:hypothetical protein
VSELASLVEGQLGFWPAVEILQREDPDLEGVRAQVGRVLSATGLDRHLATFPTVADAITGRRPDAGTADAGTGTAGHVATIRPAAALRAGHAASGTQNCPVSSTPPQAR